MRCAGLNGNNNAYCQDNEISWFDWRLVERHADIHQFVKSLVEARQQRGALAKDSTLSLNQVLRGAQIEWHGVTLDRPDWSEYSHSIAFTAHAEPTGFLLHGMLNAYWEPLIFELPPVPDGQQSWLRWIDTALAHPDDICTWNAATVSQSAYVVQPRSLVVLARQLENVGFGAREASRASHSRCEQQE